MQVQTLYFGILSEFLSGQPTSLELPEGSTAGDVRGRLVVAVPDAEAVLARAMVSINKAYADDATILQEGDELAFLPPVSGG